VAVGDIEKVQRNAYLKRIGLQVGYNHRHHFHDLSTPVCFNFCIAAVTIPVTDIVSIAPLYFKTDGAGLYVVSYHTHSTVTETKQKNVLRLCLKVEVQRNCLHVSSVRSLFHARGAASEKALVTYNPIVRVTTESPFKERFDT